MVVAVAVAVETVAMLLPTGNASTIQPPSSFLSFCHLFFSVKIDEIREFSQTENIRN